MSGDFGDLAQSGEICDIYKQFLLNNFMGEILDINKIYVYEKFTDIDEVAKILSQKHGKKIEIIVPKTGDKRNICDIAYQNGEISIKKYKNVEKFDILREIKEYFKLENLPINIEGFDNSQLFGSAIVGAMVSYNESGFNKNNYRHFHLQSPDDYGQMKQMLSERAKRFDKLSPPDLWVIDGGKALFDLASLIVQSSGANIDIIAIAKEKIDAKAHRAKGGAKDKIYTKFGEFLLSQNDKKLQFIQKIRDEAHRFVITFHQNVRKKRDLQSSKLRNLGVSDGSIAKLISYFGTFDEIYKSDYETVAKITNTKVADKLFFNKKSTK
jgi:uvrABC system protein C